MGHIAAVSSEPKSQRPLYAVKGRHKPAPEKNAVISVNKHGSGSAARYECDCHLSGCLITCFLYTNSYTNNTHLRTLVINVSDFRK